MFALPKQSYLDSNRYVLLGVLASIILHILFVFLVSSQSDRSHFESSKVIEVSFDLPLERPKPPPQIPQASKQIVNVPDKILDQAPPDKPAFTSDKDNRTEKEQIRRGDAPDAGPSQGRSQASAMTMPSSQQKSLPQKTAPRTSEKNPVKSSDEDSAPIEKETGELSSVPKAPLKTLKLDNKTLLEKFADKPKQPPNRLLQPQDSQVTDPADYAAFSRPQGTGAAIIGLSGSNDYLPNLPDGDITMLNTKASLFAVFVRRVATQVFSQMRRSGWETLHANDINSIDTFSTVHAVLNPEGHLISAKIEGPSGSARFDTVLLDAVRSVVKDPNPPQAALAEDGNFHFIFKSRSWSRVGHSARTGAPFEQRWLLLATGLE